MQSLTTTFFDEQKTSEAKFNEKRPNVARLINTVKIENKTTNTAKMSNKRCIKAKIAVLTARL